MNEQGSAYRSELEDLLTRNARDHRSDRRGRLRLRSSSGVCSMPHPLPG